MEVRLLSFNIHKGVGWKSRHSTINQIKTELTELQPDIILLQEVLGSQLATLATDIWKSHYGRNVVYKNDDHGNAILSKYPNSHISNLDLSVNRYERRGLLHTLLQLPENRGEIHLFCVHLGLFPLDRRKQITRIIEYIEENVPKQAPFILGGDFNDWAGYANKPLLSRLSLNEAFMINHGTCAKTYPAWSPIFKLDRIYSRGVEVSQSQRLLTKAWKNLSDHIAIEVIFDF